MTSGGLYIGITVVREMVTGAYPTNFVVGRPFPTHRFQDCINKLSNDSACCTINCIIVVAYAACRTIIMPLKHVPRQTTNSSYIENTTDIYIYI